MINSQRLTEIKNDLNKNLNQNIWLRVNILVIIHKSYVQT